MMIVYLLYMAMGILVGILIKHEIDSRRRKRREKSRLEYLVATANESDIRQYDYILDSLRSINRSLSDLEKNKKEVQ